MQQQITARLISPRSEYYKFKKLFEANPKFGNEKISADKFDSWVEDIDQQIKKGKCLLSAGFDQENNLVSFVTGFPLFAISGWMLGIVKIGQPKNHFYDTAQIITVANDFLINHMENLGFYKFWVIGPYRELEMRFNIMPKVSPIFARYQSFEEEVIKKGTRSKVKVWDFYLNNDEDVVVKMMVLKNQYRKQFLNLENFLL